MFTLVGRRDEGIDVVKLPFWALAPLYYGFLVVAFALVVVFSPLIIVNTLILSACVHWRWRKKGKDILVVYADNSTCEERMKHVVPLVGLRAEFLNWSEKKRWGWWSLAPNLYRFHAFFGGTPPFARQRAFPEIYIFKNAVRVTRLNFWSPRKSEDEVLLRLRNELAELPTTNDLTKNL